MCRRPGRRRRGHRLPSYQLVCLALSRQPTRTRRRQAPFRRPSPPFCPGFRRSRRQARGRLPPARPRQGTPHRDRRPRAKSRKVADCPCRPASPKPRSSASRSRSVPHLSRCYGRSVWPGPHVRPGMRGCAAQPGRAARASLILQATGLPQSKPLAPAILSQRKRTGGTDRPTALAGKSTGPTPAHPAAPRRPDLCRLRRGPDFTIRVTPDPTAAVPSQVNQDPQRRPLRRSARIALHQAMAAAAATLRESTPSAIARGLAAGLTGTPAHRTHHRLHRDTGGFVRLTQPPRGEPTAPGAQQQCGGAGWERSRDVRVGFQP